MKITIETKQTETIELQTPAYFKAAWGTGVYYINDDVLIHVMKLGIVCYTNKESVFNSEVARISKFEPTTASHFRGMYEEAISDFKHLTMHI